MSNEVNKSYRDTLSEAADSIHNGAQVLVSFVEAMVEKVPEDCSKNAVLDLTRPDIKIKEDGEIIASLFYSSEYFTEDGTDEFALKNFVVASMFDILETNPGFRNYQTLRIQFPLEQLVDMCIGNRTRPDSDEETLVNEASRPYFEAVKKALLDQVKRIDELKYIE